MYKLQEVNLYTTPMIGTKQNGRKNICHEGFEWIVACRRCFQTFFVVVLCNIHIKLLQQ